MSPSALIAVQSFQSGHAGVTLIELYTSEGCSSCPPAEAWLNALRPDPDLWREYVPVAFHVNYWDRLGWRDVLASKPFTDRQHRYAAAWNASSVYTPCFVRDGHEWRPTTDRPRRQEPQANPGELTLIWDPAEQICRISFKPEKTPSTSSQPLAASVALLGGGIISDVRKGENAGRKLQHEFVALQMQTIPLTRDAASETWTGQMTLRRRSELKTERLALAGWVHGQHELTPLQATGGWLDK